MIIRVLPAVLPPVACLFPKQSPEGIAQTSSHELSPANDGLYFLISSTVIP